MNLCKICEKEVPPSSRKPRKYCSKECQYIAYNGRPRLPRPTECIVCGQPFEFRGAGMPKRVCSPLCRTRRDHQAKKMASPSKTYAITCKGCGEKFETTKSNAVACSDACRKTINRVRSSENWEKQKASRPEFKEISCSVCKKPVILPSNFTQAIASHPHCKEQRQKARNRQKRAKRIGARQTMRNFTLDALGDRDGWICHICNEPVDPLLPGNHKQGPTVDHVWPLSKGGSNDPDNLKLAHWICNIRKSDKVNYAQSR